MASKDGLLTRKLAATSKVVRVLDMGSVALRIAYTGASTTAPVITIITATSLTLTTSLGSTVFTFGAAAPGFGTLALLAAGINAGSGDTAGLVGTTGVGPAGTGFSCKILDAIPTQITTASNLVVSGGLVASIVNGETVYDAMLDTSTSLFIGYRVTMDRNVNLGMVKEGHRVKIAGFSYIFNPNGALANAIKIYEYNKADGTTTQIWGALSVDQGAGATFDWSTNPLTAAEGNEYVVALTDGTSLTADPTNFLQVSYIRE